MRQPFIGAPHWSRFIPQMQIVFDQANDAVFFINASGKILLVNLSALQMTGYKQQELIGKPVKMLFPDHPIFSDYRSFRKISEKESEKFQTQLTIEDGHKRFVEVTHIHFQALPDRISCIIVKNISGQVISEALREANLSITSSLSVDEIYSQILIELKRLVTYDGGNILQITGGAANICKALGYDDFGQNLYDLVNSLSFKISDTENIRRVVSTKKPLVYNNTHLEPDWHINESSSYFNSWIGVPIVIDDEVDSIISLEKVEAGYFTEEHASIISVFANQAASALKNARLFEGEARRIQQMKGLQSTLAAINSNLEINTLLKEIVLKAIKLLRVESGELALYDAETDRLKIIISHSPKYNLTGRYIEKGKGAMGRAASTKKLVTVDKISGLDVGLSEETDLVSRSGMAVPLMSGNKLLGVLGIADLKHTRSFSEDEKNLLLTFAQQATIAINNSQLLENATRQAEEAETINRVGAVVAASLDQKESIRLILEQLSHVIPHDIAAVLLRKNDYLAIVGGRGFEDLDLMMGKRLMLEDALPSSQVYKNRESLRVGNVPAQFPEVNRETGVAAEIKSWLGAPLVIQERTIGIIFLNSYHLDAFTQDHVRLLTAFANQVAIALENSRLYTNLSKSAERLRTLYELGQAISSNLRSDAIYPAIHHAVTELLPADFFGICLFDQQKQIIQDVYMVHRGQAQPLSTRPLDKGLTSSVLRSGKSQLFSNFDAAKAKEVGSVMLAKVTEDQMPQSILIVPLKINNRIIGALTVESSRPDLYDNASREMLELLSANVAIAIENARLFDEVQELAITDPLTKIYNRRKFEELALKELDRSRRYHHNLCILMIDIDHFKNINDQYGHVAGDQVLSSVAAICRKNIRSIDILARYGGEEFVILLPETRAVQAMMIANRVRQDCAQTEFATSQGDVRVTISLGLAETNDMTLLLEELIDRADQALYMSKNAGRNTCSVYSPALTNTMLPTK